MIENLRPLAYFVAVVDTGSISGAAEKLSLTPSVVSRAVKELEERLGVNLLYRDGRRVMPTPAGMQLYKKGSVAQEMLASAMDEVISFKSLPTGTLRIALPAALSAGWLPPLLVDFRKRYPDVLIDLNISDAHINIFDNEIDVAVRIGQSVEDVLVQRKLGDMELLLVAAPGIWPSDLDENDIRGNGKIPLIVRSAGSIDATKQARYKDSNEWKDLDWDVKIRADSSLSSYQFAKKGLGAVYALRPCIEEELKSGELVRLIPDWRLRPAECFIIMPSKQPTAAARAFIDLMTIDGRRKLASSDQTA